MAKIEKKIIITSTKKKEASTVDLSGILSNDDSGYQDHDNFDTLAITLIDQIQEGVLELSNLQIHQRFVLFRYIYRHNPVIGRILDLHTNIPLSKFRLQPPQNVPEILKDFIMQFYSKILDRIDFGSIIIEMVLNHYIYGTAKVLIDDYFLEENTSLQDLSNVLKDLTLKKTEEEILFLSEIEEKYSENPESIDLETRMKYLESKFSGFFNRNYSGPDTIRVLDIFKIEDFFENKDIDFEAIKYKLSSSLLNLISNNESFEELQDLGYSKGWLELINISEEDDSIVIDNDEFSGFPFIFSLTRFDNTSLIQRVFNEAIEWEVVKKAFRSKTKNIGQIGRIVTSDDLSEPQIDILRAEVQALIEDPSHAIIANFPINFEEVNSSIKEELDQLIDMASQISENLSLGMGFPESIISGDSQYSGDLVKLEVLNTEYLQFKISIQNIIENKIFKPIAQRKGLFAIDSWGSPSLIIPKVSFSRISIRDESVFDLLFSLYQKGSLPIEIIYELLNIESDDVERRIQNDLFTVSDPNFNDILRDIYSNVSDVIAEETDVKDKIIDSLGLQKVDEDEE